MNKARAELENRILELVQNTLADVRHELDVSLRDTSVDGEAWAALKVQMKNLLLRAYLRNHEV